jgi:hypothetical protein
MIKWFAVICVICLVGCTTKTRNIELDGMYVTDAGTLAIGSADITASPVGEETATIKYAEDTAWLSPSTKLREIKIILTGTNSVGSAATIVESICGAFVETAPIISNPTGAKDEAKDDKL